MSGRIVYTPDPPKPCLYGCRPPKASDFINGTRWQCDTCDKIYEKWSGSQYNEYYEAWRPYEN